MKELSIEEKAKRYDEAIKVANKYKDTHIMFPQIKEEIFPELKESEDEKIRKHLISLFEKFVTLGVANECETSEIKVDDILAWLEKQGEQKHTPKHKVGDTIYYNSFGKVKSMIVANVTTDSTNNPMYEDENGNAVFEEDLIEQKPAWTPMDEQRVENLLAIIEGHGYHGEVVWLKYFKERVQPQQEWSEEDEKVIKSILNHYKFMDEEWVNWLKSLKDRVQH